MDGNSLLHILTAAKLRLNKRTFVTNECFFLIFLRTKAINMFN